MTIQKILECRSCLEIFPKNINEADKIYISLMKQFHPDICTDDNCSQASAVINNLYRRIKKSPEKKIENLYPECIDFQYIKSYNREDGVMYYCGDSVIYIIDREAWQNNIFMKNGVFRLNSERCVNDEICHQMNLSLPEILDIIHLANGNVMVKIKLENDEFPLDELLDFYGKDIDSRHCAWIISRLIGLGCFAHTGGNVLNCICTDNFMVSPSMHSLRLTGGWWFMTANGENMTGVPSAVYDVMPVSVKTDRKSNFSTDLECIRAVCRNIFPVNAPKAMLDFSENICSENIFSEFDKWEDTINKSFGGRYFTEMKLCSADIYI